MYDAGYWLSSNKSLTDCIQEYSKYLIKGNSNLFAGEFEKWRESVL